MKCLPITELLVVVLVCTVSSPFITACDDLTEAPTTVDISGKVLSLPATPVAGATVELLDGSKKTVSGADGTWRLEGLPAGEDPFLKITARHYPTAYNSYPISMGFTQYDLQVVDSLTYILMTMEDVAGGADPETLCLVFGAVVGFASMDYPQQVVPIEGAKVVAGSGSDSNEELTVRYLDETGMANPELTATSKAGAFTIVVRDTERIHTIELKGTKPGTELIGAPSQPVWPRSFVAAGLIDPFFEPQ